MSKTNKILLYLFGFLLVCGLFFLIVRGLTNKSSQKPVDNTQTNLPDYVLSQSDETKVKEFVKNFINLYNTYGYADFSNLTALGDYQTVNFQNKTKETVSSLETSTPVGYQKETQAKPETFSYKYPLSNLLKVYMDAKVEEKVSDQNLQISPRTENIFNSYDVKITVELVPSGKNWLVNDILIQKIK